MSPVVAVPVDVKEYSFASTTVIVYPAAFSSTLVVIPSKAAVDRNLTVSPVVLLCLNSVTYTTEFAPALPDRNGFKGNNVYAEPTETNSAPPRAPEVPVPAPAVNV